MLATPAALSIAWLQNGGQPTFIVRAQFARYALTQPEALEGGRFNTTEIHCTEYFPGTHGCEPPALAVQITGVVNQHSPPLLQRHTRARSCCKHHCWGPDAGTAMHHTPDVQHHVWTCTRKLVIIAAQHQHAAVQPQHGLFTAQPACTQYGAAQLCSHHQHQ